MARKPTPWDGDPFRSAPDYDWDLSASIISTHEAGPDYDYDIQVIRIGDTAWVGLPGEPFVESSVNIKLGSPAERTYVVHMPRYPDCCYIPTALGWKNGGYEARRDVCRFAAEALDIIIEAAIGQVKQMWEK